MKDSGRAGNERKRSASPARMDISTGAVFSAGFSVIASALAGFYIGVALDRGQGKTRFAPVGLLLGLLVGFHRAYILFRQIAKGKGK